MRKSAPRWALRAAAGAVIVLALTGPAPGSVGGCNSELADPRLFCIDRLSWYCRRDLEAGRINGTEFGACSDAVEGQCPEGTTWPVPGCAPTVAQTNLCLELLQRVDLLEISSDELINYPDCRLCPGAP